MPKVSVIIPVYNAEKSLAKCLDSILNQEYKDIEIIAVDDGSIDSSKQILDYYREKDDRLKVISKDNSGVSDSRNIGISIAEGEFIQFVDADDYITRDSTKIFVRAMEENEVDMVISRFYRVIKENLSVKGDIDEYKILTKEEYADYMLKNPADYYYGVIWNKFFKKSVIDKYDLRFDKNMKWCEDLIFNMEYILHIENICAILAPTYYYVKSEGSIVSQSMTLSKIVRMKLNVIEYYDDFYKNVYQNDDYKKRHLDIYKFLFDYAKDEFIIPFMPGTKKIGREEVPVFVDIENKNSLFMNFYFLNKFFDRNLNTVAKQFDIALNELKVIIFMKYANGISDMRPCSDYVGVSVLTIFSILQVLYLKKYVSVEVKNDKTVYTLKKTANKIFDELEKIAIDFYSTCSQGLSDEEKKLYLKFYIKTIKNIKESL